MAPEVKAAGETDSKKSRRNDPRIIFLVSDLLLFDIEELPVNARSSLAYKRVLGFVLISKSDMYAPPILLAGNYRHHHT